VLESWPTQKYQTSLVGKASLTGFLVGVGRRNSLTISALTTIFGLDMPSASLRSYQPLPACQAKGIFVNSRIVDFQGTAHFELLSIA
jgi:hypothetical protein